MEGFWKALYHMTGKVYIPNEALDSSLKILHISDTPSMIYRSIIRVIKRIQPDILVHTGDVVDDIKLEMLPQHIKKYRARARDFFHDLTPHVKDRLIVVPGNHDSTKVLNVIKGVEVYEEGSILYAYDMRIGLSHKPENLPDSCNYYMYGHCKTNFNDSKYLNGIDSMSVLKVQEDKVIKLFYPTGTDDYRLRRSKTGI